MEETVNQRVKKIIDELYSGNKRAFATSVGVSATVIENIVGTRSGNPSFEVLSKMYSNANVSIEWLISGRGVMLADLEYGMVNEVSENYVLRTDRKKKLQTIPLYDFKASAGLISLFNNRRPNIIDHITIPNLPKCDGAISVTGDSMYPVLKAGDIVIYKIINNIKDNIFWGEMYLLSYTTSDDDRITVKYVQKSDLGPDYIKLVSQNKHHEAKDIPLRQITAMALVKASIRINTMS